MLVENLDDFMSPLVWINIGDTGDLEKKSLGCKTTCHIQHEVFVGLDAPSLVE